MLELSIVILIISLIAGSGAVIGRATLDSTQNVSTNSRLNVIETALQAFRLIGNRLPCPADGTLTESSADFGKEAANVGSCTGGTPAANFTTAFGSTNIVFTLLISKDIPLLFLLFQQAPSFLFLLGKMLTNKYSIS